MGSIHKPTFTKPLPPKGRAVTYRVTTGKDGSQRIVVESGTYAAKYRDGSGLVQTVSTGCRDEGAARSMLGELERRAKTRLPIMLQREWSSTSRAIVSICRHEAARLGTSARP